MLRPARLQVSALAAATSLVVCPYARAQSLDDVVVTATRVPETADRIPVAISVVSGPELVARGATDLAAALSLVPGVQAPAGGDAGPSSAVPAFWGLHEFDAFLLVVDGVPWGGAFNPGVTTLSLNDVQRIEVLKGPAPVMYGATSFAGVVQAIHYPAGQAANEADIALGDDASRRGSVSLVLPTLGSWRQSLAVDAERLGFGDARERVADGHALYRGEGPLGAGTLRVDADISRVRDVPPSPVNRVGSSLTPLIPVDANFNPADAKIDEDRYHLTAGYTVPTRWGEWQTLASFAYSAVTDVRAFLHPDLSGAADTQQQRRYIDDGYLDTHLAHSVGDETTLVVGADLLFGRGQQTTRNGNSAYTVPLDGVVLPPAASPAIVNEIGTVNDRRIFAGQYAQIDWKPSTRWDVTAGLRLNEAQERKMTSDLLLPPPQLAQDSVSRTTIRPSQTIGVSYRLWAAGRDEFVVFADFRNAFKPPANDFGPDYRPKLLSAETAQSYEGGFKAANGNGRLTYQAELFLLDFSNLVVATSTGALANGGSERMKGIEAELRYQAMPDLSLVASASYHDARYRDYLFIDSAATVQLGGNLRPLSPHVLAATGLLYAPPQGLEGSVVAQYIGRQFLDERNAAPVGGYRTLAANVGYKLGRYRLVFEGANLTDQRPPVSASEFGSQSYYRLNPRRLWLRLSYSWR